MASNTYDFCITQGSSFSLQLNARNSDNSYINLSGYSASGQVRFRYSDTGVLVNLAPLIHPSYISGLLDINLTAAQTSLLPVTLGRYDLEIYSGTYVCKLLQGKVSIFGEVTR